MKSVQLVLVAHNIRSALNVGSLLRTAEGLGINTVYLTGYTPYPQGKSDIRLPHQRKKQTLQIHKTALGAEYFIKWHQVDDIGKCIANLKKEGYTIACLEQTPGSAPIGEFKPKSKMALVVGNEVTGLEKNVLEQADYLIQIPMKGRKESFNVAVASAIALYHLRYIT